MPRQKKTTSIKAFKPKLTYKQQGFISELINDPKISATEAVKRNYNVSSDASAAVIGSNLLKQPEVVMALGEYVDIAEEAIVATIKDWGHDNTPRRREIATQNAQYLHDKVFGKATTRIETHSEVVKISINLTGNGQLEPGENDTVIDLTGDT